MDANELTSSSRQINAERIVADLTSVFQRSCDNNTTAYNNLTNQLQSNCKIDTVAGINYLYMPYSRGGNSKISMELKENFCNKCNNNMKGGCYSCRSGKMDLDKYFGEAIALLPRLYRNFNDKRLKKIKGGDNEKIELIKDPNSSIQMKEIMNTTYLDFSTYTQFKPFDISSQISL